MSWEGSNSSVAIFFYEETLFKCFAQLFNFFIQIKKKNCKHEKNFNFDDRQIILHITMGCKMSLQPQLNCNINNINNVIKIIKNILLNIK